MKRLLNILVFFALALPTSPQEETRIVDSLRNVLPTQEGREKVLTMIELTWDFYDISFDDCIAWGEKAINEANALGYNDLEAKANYVVGIQYAYHADLDLARKHLQAAYGQFDALSDTRNAFESLWHLATYELTLGSVDTAYALYERALPLSLQLNDTSAYAYVLSNMGLAEHNRSQREKAFGLYEQANRIFQSVGDERMSLRMEYNLAIICSETGLAAEACDRCRRIMPKFEEYGDYYALFSMCKNLGKIYMNDCVDYDSAMFYLQKAMSYVERPMMTRESALLVDNEKSEAVVLMGDILARKGEFREAIMKYEEALALAEKSAYPQGKMEACAGLGKVYSQTGQPAKSLHYLNRFVELERTSGTMMMRPSVRQALLLDYARLGMFADLELELAGFEEDYSALQRENADVYDQLRTLRQESSELLEQYEGQGVALREQQTLANHYRMLFFGLLAMALAVLFLVLATKIVRKKRAKKEKG